MPQNNVKMLRKGFNLTQEAFAEFCGLSLPTISRAECGRNLSMDSALAIAEACGVGVDFVMGTDENNKKPLANGKGLMSIAINRVLSLSEPELYRLQAFLDGLEAGRDISATSAIAPDPADESAE